MVHDDLLYNLAVVGSISLHEAGRTGKAPKLDLTAVSQYRGDVTFLTPRSRAGVIAYRQTLQFNQSQRDLHGQHYLYTSFDDSSPNPIQFNAADEAQAAFNQKQSDLADAATIKKKDGVELSAYERQVRTDDRRESQRYWKQMGGRVGAAVAGVTVTAAVIATAPVTVPAAATVFVASVVGGSVSSTLDTYACKDFEIKNEQDVKDLKTSAITGGVLGALTYGMFPVGVALKNQVTPEVAYQMTTSAKASLGQRLGTSVPTSVTFNGVESKLLSYPAMELMGARAANESAHVAFNQTAKIPVVKSVAGELIGENIGVAAGKLSANPLRGPANTTAPLSEAARATGTHGGIGFGHTLVGAESRAAASGLGVINGGKATVKSALDVTAQSTSRYVSTAGANGTVGVIETVTGPHLKNYVKTAV